MSIILIFKENREKIFVFLTELFFALYIFSIPAFSGRPKFNLISIVLMGFLVGLVTVNGIFEKRFKFYRELLILPIFVFWTFLGTLFYSKMFTGVRTTILLAITFFVLYGSLIIIGDIRKSLRLVIYSFLAFSFYFLFVYRNSLRSILNGARLGAYFNNVNHIGTFMSFAFIISLFLSLFSDRKIYLLFLGASFLFIFVGYCTGSRTFLVNTLISTSTLIFFKFKKKPFLLLLILATLTAVFLFIFFTPAMSFLRKQIENSIYTIFGLKTSASSTAGVDGSTKSRVVWQLYAITLGARNPLIGYGYGGFSIFSGVGTYTHGNFCELLCDTGLVGTLLFYVFMIIPILKTKNSKEKIIVITFLEFTIINSVLCVFYFDKSTYLYMAFSYYIAYYIKGKETHCDLISIHI